MRQLSFAMKSLALYGEEVRQIREVYASGQYRQLLLHVYTGIVDQVKIGDLIARLREVFPDALIVGTATGGEICQGRLTEKGLILTAMFFESTRLRVARFDQAFYHERETGRRIRDYIDANASDDLKAAELLLPGSLMNTTDMYDELRQCDRRVRIFGGYAGDHDADLSRAFVLTGDGVFEDAVVVVLYEGKDFHINASKSAGWEKLGVPLKVTKASGNLLEEIDGISAAQVYQKYLSIERDEKFAENTNEFPLMAQVGDEELLRHTNEVMDDGALMLAGNISEGWDVYLSFGNPSGIINRVNTRLEEIRQFRPQGLLLYSCYVRRLFWESFVNVELEPFEKLAPTAGFYTFGEVLRNMDTGNIMEYNITLLSIAMREGEPPQALPEKAQADASVLSGQASLIKRLAELVYYSNLELQKAYSDLQSMNEKLTVLAEHDSLTGLYNRGRIEAAIGASLDRAADSGELVSLVMLDIDHFKKINDTYGHKAGDMVLVELAGIMQRMTDRQKDEMAGRWGGEEFFIVLPGTDQTQALSFAQRLRTSVEEHSFPGIPGLTISVSTITATGREVRNDLYVQIDNALYEAKEGGRNRVVQAEMAAQ